MSSWAGQGAARDELRWAYGYGTTRFVWIWPATSATFSAATLATLARFPSSRFSALTKETSASSTLSRRFDAGMSGADFRAFSFTSYSRYSTWRNRTRRVGPPIVPRYKV